MYVVAMSSLKRNNVTFSNGDNIRVIVAENWSASEITNIDAQIDMIFHFNMNPNKFMGFNEEAQIKFNKYMATILGASNDKQSRK